MSDKQLVWAERITKLLRKAESTDSPAEADALTTKAQELMVTYAVTDELLNHAAGRERPDKIVLKVIRYTGIFQSALLNVGYAVCRANECRGVYRTVTWEKPKRTELDVVGFERDVDRVIMLNTSLQVQVTAALQRWWRSEDRSWLSGMQKYKERRQFIVGFAKGVRQQLHEARRTGEAEAVIAEAQRTKTAETEVRHSMELVQVSKKERVDDWMDVKYGRSLRSVTRRYQFGGHDAHSAGNAAGRSADLGRERLGGGAKELGR